MFAHNPVILFVTAFLLGCGFASAPALQTRIMDLAVDAKTLAAASIHSAFNVANALGAWLEGLIIAAGRSYASTAHVGAVSSVAGLVLLALSHQIEKSAARP